MKSWEFLITTRKLSYPFKHIKKGFNVDSVNAHFNPNLATMDGNEWGYVAPALHLPLSSYLVPFLENFQRHLAQNKSSFRKR